LPNEHVLTRLVAESPGFPWGYGLKGRPLCAPAKECANG